MAELNSNKDSEVLEEWEQELLARHRWGQHGNRASEEYARLKKFWKAAQPLSQKCKAVIEQIVALEIYNWNLEESILELCSAIGTKKPTKLCIGHLASISEERWNRVWAYYLTLRNWLPSEGRSGYASLLKKCDPNGTIQNHIVGMLGSRDELKELYVERLCLCLEYWLGGLLPTESAQLKAHSAAVLSVENEIRRLIPVSKILNAVELEGDGRLQPCNHKAFRRYDIIISSIGADKWRAVMPMRGTDGFERAATLERFFLPIEVWIDSRSKKGESKDDELFDRIHSLLGKPDNARLFLASLLISLLRAQQLAAQKRAESRKDRKNN
jgi:hypothetical protein